MWMQTIHEKELGKAEKLLFLQSEPLAGLRVGHGV